MMCQTGDQLELSEKWRFRLDVLQYAACWSIPVCAILVVDSMYWNVIDGSYLSPIVYVPGLVINVLHKGPWTGLHNYSHWELCLKSCICYFLSVWSVVAIVMVERRNRARKKADS